MPVRNEEEQEAARDRDGACTAPASDMPGMVSLAAWCLSWHGTPDIMVSRPAWCPARRSMAEVAILQQGTRKGGPSPTKPGFAPGESNHLNPTETKHVHPRRRSGHPGVCPQRSREY